jgi:hypothetical protein
MGLLVATGSLGQNASANAGFDIFSDVSAGKTIANTAFATFFAGTDTSPSFYTVDVLTGATSFVDQFPANITDIAVALDTN